jgi:hypothetical protein
MVLINSRIEKTIIHHVLNCLPTVQFPVSIAQNVGKGHKQELPDPRDLVFVARGVIDTPEYSEDRHTIWE